MARKSHRYPQTLFKNLPAVDVMEWCADAFSHRGSMYRVYKGGSYYSGAPRFLRCAWKGGARPELGEVFWGFVGFRVALGGE